MSLLGAMQVMFWALSVTLDSTHRPLPPPLLFPFADPPVASYGRGGSRGDCRRVGISQESEHCKA